MSSGYFTNLAVFAGISSPKMFHRAGPSRLPWGTPISTDFGFDFVLDALTITDAVRSVRKLFVMLIVLVYTHMIHLVDKKLVVHVIKRFTVVDQQSVNAVAVFLI